MVVLNTVNADSSTYVSDAVLGLYDERYAAAVDVDDAIKMTNFTENFSIANGGKLLSIERRRPFEKGDTLFFNIAKMQRKNYQLEFITKQLKLAKDLVAMLEDTYLNTKTPIDLDLDTSRINFSIKNNEEARSDRFRLVFMRKPRCILTSVAQVSTGVLVQWQVLDQYNSQPFIIERSSNGYDFTSIGKLPAVESSSDTIHYQWQDQFNLPGVYYYRVRYKDENGNAKVTDNLKVEVVNGKPGIYVYPNPITDNVIQLRMNDQTPGMYRLRILAANGAVMINRQLQFPGGSGTLRIPLQQGIPTGNYTLELYDGQQAALIQIMVAQ